MNLCTTIDLHAGGTGSGCRGSNCGRHPKYSQYVGRQGGTGHTNDVFQKYSKPMAEKVIQEWDRQKAGSRKMELSLVKAHKLYPTQRTLDKRKVSGLIEYAQRDRTPMDLRGVVVAKYQGKLYVIDGHHRLAAYMLSGHPKMHVSMVQL